MSDKIEEAQLLKRLYQTAKMRDDTIRQAKLAKACGVSPSMVAGWMNGHSRCPDRSLVRLGELLDFDPTLVRPDVHERLGDKLERRQRIEALTKKIDDLDDAKLEQVSDFIGFILRSRV